MYLVEEILAPRKDAGGDLICDDCYNDEYEFTCSKCENYANISDRDTIGNLLIVVDSEEAKMPAGVYEIVKHPYWGGDMFSMWLYPTALKLLSSDTFGLSIENMNYPVGHVCPECKQEIVNKISGDS
jgi:hypothetical protein